MLSRFLDFLENNSCLALLTPVTLLVQSYRRTTNLSITAIELSSMSSGIDINVTNIFVSSGYTFQTSHAVFLPFPAKK